MPIAQSDDDDYNTARSMTYHPLLEKQIRKYLEGVVLSKELKELLSAINQTYIHADEDRKLLERSLEISSEELNRINATLQKNIQELQIEHNKFTQYVDIAGVLIVVIDPNQLVSLINKKGSEILKYSESEIIGKNWFDTYIPSEQREVVRGVFTQIMQGNIAPVEYYENYVVVAGGQRRLIAWHNALLKDEKGKICGTLSSGQDITEKSKQEEELKKLNNLMIGRELKMVELKEEIKKLKSRV